MSWKEFFMLNRKKTPIIGIMILLISYYLLTNSEKIKNCFYYSLCFEIYIPVGWGEFDIWYARIY
jgi:hypothetical protein